MNPNKQTQQIYYKCLQRMTEKVYDKHTVHVNYCFAHEG